MSVNRLTSLLLTVLVFTSTTFMAVGAGGGFVASIVATLNFKSDNNATPESRYSNEAATAGAYCPTPSPSDSTHEEELPDAIGEFIGETGFYQSIAVENDGKPLHKQTSKYQEIAVYRSNHYGKILVLDGVVQLTERDADSYNEMMAHIPMMAHIKPRRVLIIGGGDGYVLSEVLKHPSVEQVDHVDLDGDVISTCRDHFSWGGAWDDPRVKLHVADGASFIRDTPNSFYDVIIQDSSDPWSWDEEGEIQTLPSSTLYTAKHFENIARILTPGGFFNFQAETFNIPSDLKGIVSWRTQALRSGFESAKYGTVTISSYPTGQIGFLFCQKKGGRLSSDSDVRRRFDGMERNGQGTTYYHPRLQRSSFDLPLWAEKIIYGGSRASNLEGDACSGKDEL